MSLAGRCTATSSARATLSASSSSGSSSSALQNARDGSGAPQWSEASRHLASSPASSSSSSSSPAPLWRPSSSELSSLPAQVAVTTSLTRQRPVPVAPSVEKAASSLALKAAGTGSSTVLGCAAMTGEARGAASDMDKRDSEALKL